MARSGTTTSAGLSPRSSGRHISPASICVPGNLELHEFEHDTPKVLAEGRQRGDFFFTRIAKAISEVDAAYDVVIIDCPPQLGFLTLSAICAATGTLVTIYPQLLDVASMSQFLHMSSGLLSVVRQAGEISATISFDIS